MSEQHPINADVKMKVGEYIIAIGDNILVSDMEFRDSITHAGIIIINDDQTDRGIHPRWAKVYAMGPRSINDFKIGQYILISHGRWSRGINLIDVNGIETVVRRVDPKDILLVYNGEGIPDTQF